MSQVIQKKSREVKEEIVLDLIAGIQMLLNPNVPNADFIGQLWKGLNALSNIRTFTNAISECEGFLVCIACKTYKTDQIRLNCKHFLCADCLSPMLQNLINVYNLTPSFNCPDPTCKRHHSYEDMEILCKEKWNELILDIKCARKNNNLDFVCTACEQQKPKKQFPDTFMCSNHKFCKECLASKFRKSYYKCHQCNILFKDDPTSFKGFCTSCSESVYYVGDYLTSLCKMHSHCFNCIKEALGTRRCGTCSEPLSDNDVRKAWGAIKSTCYYCGIERDDVLFFKKKCCQTMVCAFCQIARSEGDPFNCVACKQALEGYAIQLIEEVRAVANDIS